jgi:CRP/FNR family transcriptional regulator, dissimilatory nitrate respiration regulator
MVMIMSRAVETLFAPLPLLTLDAGQPLFHLGAPVRDMYLVRSGCIKSLRHTSHGAPLVLQSATEGAVVAEASAYSDTYHCDAVAADVSTVTALPRLRFLAALDRDPKLARAWATILARGVQVARMRAEICTLPRVADRLNVWLAEGNSLPDKGRWQDVAAALGVTREALYRELARRRG